MALEVELEASKLRVVGKMALAVELNTQESEESVMAPEAEPETRESNGKGKSVPVGRDVRV